MIVAWVHSCPKKFSFLIFKLSSKSDTFLSDKNLSRISLLLVCHLSLIRRWNDCSGVKCEWVNQLGVTRALYFCWGRGKVVLMVWHGE